MKQALDRVNVTGGRCWQALTVDSLVEPEHLASLFEQVWDNLLRHPELDEDQLGGKVQSWLDSQETS